MEGILSSYADMLKPLSEVLWLGMLTSNVCNLDANEAHFKSFRIQLPRLCQHTQTRLF